MGPLLPWRAWPTSQLVKNYFDVGAGGVVYGKWFWLGMSSRHLNMPSESLTDDDRTGAHLVQHPWRHPGIPTLRGPGRTDQDLLIAAGYRSQGGFDQVDFGISFDSPFLTYGVSYRQILMKQAPDGAPNHDAISLILGLTEEHFRVGYSYDITVSSLGLGHHGRRPRAHAQLRVEDAEPPAQRDRTGCCLALNSDQSGQHVDLPLEVHPEASPDVRLDVLATR